MSYNSFSSSLLEEIYRSFDDDNTNDDYNDVISYKKSSRTMGKSNSMCIDRKNKFLCDDRFRSLDQWIEKYDNSNRNSNSNNNLKYYSSSSTSSSDSSSGIGGFSSSESDSLRSSMKSKMKSKSLTLKPIRTNFTSPETHRKSYSDEIPAKKKSHKEGNLQKRALKLYGDLKKVKQPISPGGKLASFLNSLFNSAASKKAKIPSSPAMTSSSSAVMTSSTPSTASSYARSCLSKTPSSAGGRFERRSVRFCPVNTVIAATDKVNECNVRSKESQYNDNEELKVKIMEKQRRVEEVAKELLKNYHHGRKYNQNNNGFSNSNGNSVSNNNISKSRRFEMEYEDEEEEDDDVSCCSSDLFELENLLDIGVDRRYCEELPVYETTHVNTNRAIANGYIL